MVEKVIRIPTREHSGTSLQGYPGPCACTLQREVASSGERIRDGESVLVASLPVGEYTYVVSDSGLQIFTKLGADVISGSARDAIRSARDDGAVCSTGEQIQALHAAAFPPGRGNSTPLKGIDQVVQAPTSGIPTLAQINAGNRAFYARPKTD